MTSRLRLLMVALVLGMAWSLLLGTGGARAAAPHAVGAPWFPIRLGEARRFTAPRAPMRRSVLGVRAARYARRLLGVPYRYGGDSPGAASTARASSVSSSATSASSLPHSSFADFGLGTRVARRSLRPGDLVFFDGVGHVGLYVGAGRFIHAPHSGTTVRITSLDDPWYRERYDGARRLVPATAGRHARAAVVRIVGRGRHT